MQNINTVVVWNGYMLLKDISNITADRMHMTYYKNLTETVCLSYTVFKL